MAVPETRVTDPGTWPQPWCGRWGALALTLAFLPFASLAALVDRYGVDVPFWDQWYMMDLFRLQREGKLAYLHLWWQHNEHRPILPRLLMLGLARLTGWNVRWEMAVSLGLAALTFAVLLVLISRTRLGLGLTSTLWVPPLLSLLIFSLSQWENWLWGWQLALFLNLLAVVTGITVLAHRDLTPTRLAQAILLGVAASFSFANGLLYWLVALPLLVRPGEPRRRVALRCAIWLAAAAAVFLHYGRPKDASGPYLPLLLHRPLDLLRYFLNYLGHPVTNTHAGLAGAAALALLIGLGLSLARRGPEARQALLPYLSLSLYACLSAAMTGLGRLHLGAQQSMESRYITFANLLWIAILILLLALAQRSPADPRVTLRPLLARLALVLLLALVARTSLAALPSFPWVYQQRQPAREQLLAGADAEQLRVLLPVPADLRRGIGIIRQQHLSVFREPSKMTPRRDEKRPPLPRRNDAAAASPRRPLPFPRP